MKIVCGILGGAAMAVTSVAWSLNARGVSRLNRLEATRATLVLK